MFKFTLFTLILLLSVSPQPDFEPLTVANAHRIEQITTLDHGEVTNLYWRDEQTLAVHTTAGVFLHDLSRPDAAPVEQGGGRLPVGETSPSGDRILVRLPDGYAQLYDGITGEPRSAVHDIWWCSLEMAPSWTNIVTYCHAGRLEVWDTGRQSRGGNIHEVEFSPDGTLLFIGRENHIFLEWCRQCDFSFDVIYNRYGRIRVSPDNRHLAIASSSSEEGFLHVWDFQESQLVFESQRPILEMTFSHDDKQLVALTANTKNDPTYSLIIWTMDDLHQPPEIIELPRVPDAYPRPELQFSPDDTRLMVEVTGTLLLWDGSNWQKFDLPRERNSAYAFHPDSRRIAIATQTNQVVVWDSETRQTVATFGDYPNVTSDFAVSPDGRLIANFKECTVELWDWRQQSVQYIPLNCTDMRDGMPLNYIGQVHFIDQARLLVGTASEFVILDVNTQAIIGKYRGHASEGTAMIWTTDGTVNFAVPYFDFLHLSSTNRTYRRLTLPGKVQVIQYHPDGRSLAIAHNGSPSEVLILDSLRGDELADMEYSETTLSALAFSPDGRYLAVGGYDGLLEIRDLHDKEILTLEGGDVIYLAFSPDGCLLASAGTDRVISLWDARTGGLLKTLSGHQGDITSLEFTDTLLVSSATDTMRVWAVPDTESE